MAPDQRRNDIVATAIPLLLEHGGNVTTGQIAAAAGIAEGTVFRAFKDKQELLHACMETGMRADEAVGEIARIPTGLPLPERLAEAVELVNHYMQRMWSLMQALRVAGLRHEDIPGSGKHAASTRHTGTAQQNGATQHDNTGQPDSTGCEHSDSARARHDPSYGMMRLTRAIAEHLEQHRGALRQDPVLAARLLVGFVFANRLQNEQLGQGSAGSTELVELFLHGALTSAPDTGQHGSAPPPEHGHDSANNQPGRTRT